MAIFFRLRRADEGSDGHTTASTYAAGSTAVKFRMRTRLLGGTGEGKHPMDFGHPTMTHLAHQRDRLQPAEAFLDPLSLSLAESISSMSRGATINCAATAPCEILRYGFVFFGLSAVQLDQSRSSEAKHYGIKITVTILFTGILSQIFFKRLC